MRTRIITLRVTEAEYREICARGRISDVLRDALDELGVYPELLAFSDRPPDLPPPTCNTPVPRPR